MSRPKVVLLGMLTKIPVGGVAWLIHQYAVGFERLGYEPYYVEAHGRTPSMFMEHDDDDPTPLAVAYLDREMRGMGLAERWAFHALHGDGSVHGMTESALGGLYRDAALIINLHGGTLPLEEHAATGRLVYLGTDPVDVEVELHQGLEKTVAYLEPHVAFFTWALNYGGRTCELPYDSRFPAVPSPPPVVVDLWEGGAAPGPAFTTIGNWRQNYRDLTFRGETYRWSKHHEFLRILDLPSRTAADFELALSSYDEADQVLLEANGWRVRPALEVSADPEAYRHYIQASRGELTVAKEQNVRLRTGWFSERSATYLAAGRPVITQDTGFGAVLPTGLGLLSFADLDEAVACVAEVQGDYERHARAARDIARAYFSYDVVLGAMLDHVGLPVPRNPRRFGVGAQPLPRDLELEPVARRPLRLSQATTERVLSAPVPRGPAPMASPSTSIVMVTYDKVVVTRMAVESVLANTAEPFELVIVDNASSDGTADYLQLLAMRNPSVRVILNDSNVGFAAANNQGLAVARAPDLVLLNNDTIVPPGWLPRLLAHLEGEGVGAVGPVTNRIGNEAEVQTTYTTYGQLLAAAQERADRLSGGHFDIPVLAMFCLAMRRETFVEVGELDERFGIGLFEDDDYARALAAAGRRSVCAEDVLVHHFGEASFGTLRSSGEWTRLFEANRDRFERKWGVTWSPHDRSRDPAYDELVAQVRATVRRCVPAGARAAVISRGDARLLELGDVVGEHFPSDQGGTWAGHYPHDGVEAVRLLEASRRRGTGYLVVPRSSLWWLDHYGELQDHLTSAGVPVAEEHHCAIYDITARGPHRDA